MLPKSGFGQFRVEGLNHRWSSNLAKFGVISRYTPIYAPCDHEYAYETTSQRIGRGSRIGQGDCVTKTFKFVCSHHTAPVGSHTTSPSNVWPASPATSAGSSAQVKEAAHEVASSWSATQPQCYTRTTCKSVLNGDDGNMFSGQVVPTRLTPIYRLVNITTLYLPHLPQ
jgi:hypothetical protein